MYLVKEEKSRLGYLFNVYFNQKKIKEIFIQRVKREKDGKIYLFLIDSNGQVIEDVYEYLNFTCGIKSLNAKEQAQSALKLLYTFKEVIGKDIKDFNRSDIKNLSDFLLGISVEGNELKIEFCNTRGISSHNNYFDAIRRFIKKGSLDNELFFEVVQSNVEVERNYRINDDDYKSILELCNEKYVTNISGDNNSKKLAPKYISINEYKVILDYLEKSKSDNKMRDKIIISLMFTQGFRIGEVLGITLEDIKEHPSVEDAGRIIIRNRVSDKEYQHAKTCFMPTSKSDYNSKIYKTEGKGYYVIDIPFRLMSDLKEFISESRNFFEMTDRKIENLLEYSNADSVEINNAQENYYIFINKNGKTLTSSGWNKRLKEIFLECGIPIDKGTKNLNLNHRFRHGFAMYLTMNLKKDSIFIKSKLRHKSLKSTDMYFNPTQEDVLNSSIEIEDRMMQEIKEIE